MTKKKFLCNLKFVSGKNSGSNDSQCLWVEFLHSVIKIQSGAVCFACFATVQGWCVQIFLTGRLLVCQSSDISFIQLLINSNQYWRNRNLICSLIRKARYSSFTTKNYFNKAKRSAKQQRSDLVIVFLVQCSQCSVDQTGPQKSYSAQLLTAAERCKNM